MKLFTPNCLVRIVYFACVLVCLLAWPLSPTHAATINIDISGDDAPMPDSMGRYWNQTPLNAPVSPAYILTNAIDSTNSATPVDLNLLTPSSSGFNTTSIQTGKTGSTITNWDNAVTQDNWYVQAGNTAQVRIEGLLPGTAYDLLFYGGRAADANRLTRISINAMNQDYDATNEGLTNFTNILANNSGEILFSVSTYSTGTFAHLSGLQITGTFVVIPAPEPSSVVLLLGMIGCGISRRRAKMCRHN